MKAGPSVPERIYRSLIRWLPSEFRGDFGGAMVADVDAARRRTGAFWWREIGSLLRAIVREHLDAFANDVRYALRILRRSPAFTAAAVATIALGIGANTSMFSVIHGVLLKPLPYRAPGELVMVWQDMRARGGPPDEWATPANFVDWRGQAGTFSAMASIRAWAPPLLNAGDAEMITGEQVSQSYFGVLGVEPIRGRTFRADEAIPNAPRVVVISHRFWTTRFASAEDAVGRSLMLSGEPHQIVGVLPEAFRPVIVPDADVWRPDRLNLANPARSAIVLRIVGRLQPGVSVAQASATMDAVAAALGRQYPESNANAGVRIVPLHEQIVGAARPGMLVLVAAVAFVLVLACVNIANLLLARASGRAREMALRGALGAARGRIVRQLLTESLILALAGGTAGVLLSVLGLEAFVAMAPAGTPRLDQTGLDATVLAAAAGLTVLTGLLFGIVPAVQLARTNHTPALKEGARGAAGGAGQRVRRVLIVAQIALALMLLVGSGLLLRSFQKMQAADLGFDATNLLSAFVPRPPQPFKSAEEAVVFQDRLLEAASRVPGVTSASLTSIVPLGAGGDADMDFAIDGAPPPPPDSPGPVAWYRTVSAGYITLMGMKLVEGRSFEGREPQPSVVVSETLARRYWPGISPLGRQVLFGPPGASPKFTIIGVVADPSQQGARSPGRGQVFIPYWHAGALFAGGTNVMLKTSVPPQSLRQALSQAIRAFDPRLPITNVAPMTERVANSIEEPRFIAVITGLFATIAVILAAVGVYGVVSYSVGQRRQELGIRLALGAARGNLFGLVYADGFRLAGAGLLIGTAGAAAITPAIGTFLFEITPFDPVTFAVTCGVLVLAAALAVFVPARRAMQIDPVTTLRE